MLKQLKRHRGGQPGNQNARKHGFYTAGMSPLEASEFYNMINLGGVDREIAILRIKMNTALHSPLRNPRVFADARRLLVRWCRSRYRLESHEIPELKKIIRILLEKADTEFNKTNVQI